VISPYEESDSAEKSEVNENEKIESDINETGEENLAVAQPQAPKGLAAIFTGKKVILVWDEIIGQGIEFYRVYRSGGNDFSLIAEVTTPVYNDGNIESGSRYFYKVSSVGQSESSGSDAVEVVAGGD
jgi:fibronectin type 3 domain-containing protein